MPQFSPEWSGMGYGLVMGMFEKRCCPRGQRDRNKRHTPTHTHYRAPFVCVPVGGLIEHNNFNHSELQLHRATAINC